MRLGPEERRRLSSLAALAAQHPVDVSDVALQMETLSGRAAHQEQMHRQSLTLAGGVLVTFSIERGHPCGSCRHMSVSMPQPPADALWTQEIPMPGEVWALAEALGFLGGFAQCVAWMERLELRGDTISLLQPLSVSAEHAPGAAPAGCDASAPAQAPGSVANSPEPHSGSRLTSRFGDAAGSAVSTVSPGFWMHETTGVLRPAVEAYLWNRPMTRSDVALLRAYLRQWIMAPAWVGPLIDPLRTSVETLDSRADITAWLRRALEAGIDPL